MEAIDPYKLVTFSLWRHICKICLGCLYIPLIVSELLNILSAIADKLSEGLASSVYTCLVCIFQEIT